MNKNEKLDKWHDISGYVFTVLWFFSVISLAIGYKWMSVLILAISLLPTLFILYRISVGVKDELENRDEL